MPPVALVPLIIAAAASLPAAAQVAPIDTRWPELARSEEGDCRLVVTGNGRFYRIAATGLGPGAPGRYRLTNGDMTPIDWQVRADGTGTFARFYLPFRWHRRGGSVAVSIASERCTLSASFPWERQGVTGR